MQGSPNGCLHDRFMRAALEQAEEALRLSEVPIGCVIVDEDDRIVSRGRNRTNESRNATRHAEFEALDPLLQGVDTSAEAGSEVKPGVEPRSETRTEAKSGAKVEAEAEAESLLRRRMSRLRLYVTVEPCIMCAAALRRVGLTRVFFGCYNERFGGCGSILDIHKGIVEEAVDPTLEVVQLRQYRRECVELLRRFYIRENERAPVPRKKSRRILKPVED